LVDSFREFARNLFEKLHVAGGLFSKEFSALCRLQKNSANTKGFSAKQLKT
jgi:hypothetical protein